jgi:hypothetical protein
MKILIKLQKMFLKGKISSVTSFTLGPTTQGTLILITIELIKFF